MRIQMLTADDWQDYRDARLRALQADPGAFGSSYDREVSLDEQEWRRRTGAGPDNRPAAVFVARDGQRVSGTAAVIYPVDELNPMLVGMWVDPVARGRGAGRLLVDAVVAWAVDRGEVQLRLWVVRDNVAAIALYESCGFAKTGNVAEMPGNPCSGEVEMTLALAAGG